MWLDSLIFLKSPQWSRQAVETIFLKNKNFRLSTLKNENWESPPIFLGVIGSPFKHFVLKSLVLVHEIKEWVRESVTYEEGLAPSLRPKLVPN